MMATVAKVAPLFGSVLSARHSAMTSAMNCKQGDLAVLVDADPHATHLKGRIFKLVGRCYCCGAINWRFEGPFIESLGGGKPIGCLRDEDLRPIRPGDLEDETPTVRELEQRCKLILSTALEQFAQSEVTREEAEMGS